MSNNSLYQLHPTEIIFYSTDWCSDCHRARNIFKEKNISFKEVNIENDEKAQAFVQKINNGYNSVPTIVFPDGSTLVEPSIPELKNKLNILFNL